MINRPFLHDRNIKSGGSIQHECANMLKEFLAHIVAYNLVIFFRVAIEDGVMKFVDAHNLAGQIPNLKARVSQHLDKECLDQDQTEYLYIGKEIC